VYGNYGWERHAATAPSIENLLTSTRYRHRVDEPQVRQLRRIGLGWRLAATLVGIALLLAGTFWGEDDHFPFGPFKMYASAVDPDAPTEDTRVEAVDATGNELLLTPGNTGIRRAEFEGQLDRIQDQPALLSAVAEAYQRRNPQAPELIEVRVVVRWHEVRDFEVTGQWRDEVVATWQP
jgi:hypothetical protein